MNKNLPREKLFAGAAIVLALLAVVFIAVVTIRRNFVHEYGEEVEVPPTCLAEGMRYRVCKTCGRIDVVEALPKVPHVFSDFATVEEPGTVYAGKALSRCINCEETVVRRLPPTGNLPRVYIAGYAFGVSTVNSVGVSIACEDPASAAEGDEPPSLNCFLRYLPPAGAELHDYELSGVDRSLSVVPEIGDVDTFYLLVDHADYLHVRTSAMTSLWHTVADGVSPAYAALLSLSDTYAYEGFPIAYYQNGTYMETRRFMLPLKTYAAKHGGILHAASVGADALTAVYGSAETAEQLLNADDDDFRTAVSLHADVNVLAAYVAYCRLTEFADGLSLSLAWISPDGSLWYPLPLTPEASFGLVPGSAALADPGAPFAVNEETLCGRFFARFADVFADECARQTALLKSGALSPDAVESVFEAAAALRDDEYRTSDRHFAATDALSKNHPLSELLARYRARLAAN